MTTPGDYVFLDGILSGEPGPPGPAGSDDIPDAAADGLTDDSVPLQAFFTSKVWARMPDGAKVYKASELDVNGLSVSGSGSTIKQTVTGAKIFKFDNDWNPGKASLLEDLILDGNSLSGGYGFHSEGETNIHFRNVEINDVEHPLRLKGDIYWRADGLKVKGSGASAVWLSNIDPDGGLIAGDLQNSDFEQGSGVGLLITDVSASQGFGALTFRNTTWQNYQRCAHVITAGEWQFEGYTQSEISALATTGWPYTTESASHTVPERCVYYIGSGGAASPPGATVFYRTLVVLPPSGATGVIADGAGYVVEVGAWKGLASAKCLNGGSIKVKGAIDIAGQNARGLDLTQATPGEFLAASGGFSCWEMRARIRQNQNLRNAFVIESSGNPWTPTATPGGTTDPTITTVADPFYGNVTQVAFQAALGVAPATNLATIPVFANTNASGEYYGVSFLMRKVAGAAGATIYCGSPIGASLIGAHVVPTSTWERVVMLGRYISNAADGRLLLIPQDTAGATVQITGITSIRGTHPDDMIPVLQGEVSPR